MPSLSSSTVATPSKQASPRRDVAIVLLITSSAALISAHFELNEMLFAMTRPYEHIQLDEWPITLFVLALCLMWLSWRRNLQAAEELVARRAAERDLAAALAENRELANQNLRALEAERKHLARELHDELGQYLNAIKLDAVAIGEQADPGAHARVHASRRIVHAVDHVHRAVSDMIRRLRPVGLDELGLVAALESCVHEWRDRLPGARFSLRTSGALENLDELTSLAIYRLVQEGLTNSYKHANASHIGVELMRHRADAAGADEIVLIVSDDGRGVSHSGGKTGFGLGGMRERVQLMGGRFLVDSSPGQGFRFEAHIPLEGEQRWQEGSRTG